MYHIISVDWVNMGVYIYLQADDFIEHSVAYVLPSDPQTGSYIIVQSISQSSACAVAKATTPGDDSGSGIQNKGQL